MTGVTIKYMPVVAGDHLREDLHLKHVKQVSGMWFFRAAKSDNLIERMLVGRSAASARKLAHTTILECIAELRNAKIESILTPAAQEDLGLDDDEPSLKRKFKATDMAKLPEYITIDITNRMNMPNMKMNVLPDKFSQPLWLELSKANIEYLVNAVKHDLSNPQPSKVESRKAGVLAHRVSFEKRRNAYRARRGNCRQRYFSSADEAAAWLAESESERPMPMPLQY